MVNDQEMPRAVEFLISQVLESSALRPELFGIVFDLLFENLLFLQVHGGWLQSYIGYFSGSSHECQCRLV
jgi:hypothetical protein